MAGHQPSLTRPETVLEHFQRQSDEQQAAIARRDEQERALCRRRSALENETRHGLAPRRPDSPALPGKKADDRIRADVRACGRFRPWPLRCRQIVQSAIVSGLKTVVVSAVANARRGVATSPAVSRLSRARKPLQIVRAPRRTSSAAPSRPSARRAPSAASIRRARVGEAERGVEQVDERGGRRHRTPDPQRAAQDRARGNNRHPLADHDCSPRRRRARHAQPAPPRRSRRPVGTALILTSWRQHHHHVTGRSAPLACAELLTHRQRILGDQEPNDPTLLCTLCDRHSQSRRRALPPICMAVGQLQFGRNGAPDPGFGVTGQFRRGMRFAGGILPWLAAPAPHDLRHEGRSWPIRCWPG